MNLLQRFLKPFVADCGHDADLHQLRNQVQAARLAREVSERQVVDLDAQLIAVELLRQRAANLAAEHQAHVGLLQKQLAEAEREIERLTHSRNDLADQKESLVRRFVAAEAVAVDRERELLVQVEEATERVGELERRLLKLGVQLPLAGCESGEDEEVVDAAH